MADEHPYLDRIEAAVNRNLPKLARRTGTYRDGRRFKKRLDNYMNILMENYAPEVEIKIVMETVAGLIRATPVGNKGLWQRNRGKPESEWRPKNYVGGTARQSWRIDLNRAYRGKPKVAEVDPLLVLANTKLTDRIYISNPQPYMEQLNNGHSLQAPAGFVEEVIGRVVQKYRGEAIE